MERRRPDGQEYALDEKLNMIHEAGFDGVGIDEFFAGEPAEIERIIAFLKDHDMSWFIYCNPKSVAEFADQITQIGRWAPITSTACPMSCPTRSRNR